MPSCFYIWYMLHVMNGYFQEHYFFKIKCYTKSFKSSDHNFLVFFFSTLISKNWGVHGEYGNLRIEECCKSELFLQIKVGKNAT